MRQKRINEHGFSLLELLTVITIIGIMLAMAGIGMDFVRRERVASASRMLLGDLQRSRGQSLTSAASAAMPNMRGFGVNFISQSSYSTFTFNDQAAPVFQYNDASEAVNVRRRDIPSPVQLTIGGAAPNNRILIFDRFGSPRNGASWGLGMMTIVVMDPNLPSYARCIVVSEARIREGNYAGGNCNQQ